MWEKHWSYKEGDLHEPTDLLLYTEAAVGIQFCGGDGFLEAEELVRVGTTGKSQGLFLKCEM